MKIAVNKCFGGFGLSGEAIRFLEANHGVKIYKSWKDLEDNKKEGELWGLEDNSYSSITMYSNAEEFRTDKRVVNVIEKLGKAANGRCAGLKVIEIPDEIQYEISDYDGIETIHELHQSW